MSYLTTTKAPVAPLSDPKVPSESTGTRDPRQIYRWGMCDALAIALHRLTGCSLGLLRVYYPDDLGDEGDETYLDYHAVVMLDREVPRWLDVDGIAEGYPPVSLPVSGMRLPASARYVLEPASAEEVAEAFTVEGLRQAEIAEAGRFIKADPLLSLLVGQPLSELAEAEPHRIFHRSHT